MGLFDRHAGLLEAYRDVRTTGYDPFQIRMERVLSPTEAGSAPPASAAIPAPASVRTASPRCRGLKNT